MQDKPRKITAKYSSGTCKLCGGRVEAGDEILFAGHGDLAHASVTSCTTKRSSDPLPPPASPGVADQRWVIGDQLPELPF